MPPKRQTPAPIDRPLSRAYLRKFSGWATAFPPGISDPTSFRLMENIQINRDGSCRVRPGLKHLTYAALPTNTEPGVSIWPSLQPVGSHEAFYLSDGTKAYLFAVRQPDGAVTFRVLVDGLVKSLTEAGFTLAQPMSEINFTANTTYVKYLQIDNKVFALSNSGETMRMFFVGREKLAKKLSSIVRPEWDVNDKLEVVHPDAAWVNSGIPDDTRFNRFINPSFELDVETGWVNGNSFTKTVISDDFAQSGTTSMKVTSTSERWNRVQSPLHNPASTGLSGWVEGAGTQPLTVEGNALRARAVSGSEDDEAYVRSHLILVDPETHYNVSFDLEGINGAKRLGVMLRHFTAGDVQIGDDHYLDTNVGQALNRKVLNFKTREGCQKIRFMPYVRREDGGLCQFRFKNVMVTDVSEPTTFFHGGSGTYYFWVGDTNDSGSVYHPPKDVRVFSNVSVVGPANYTISGYFRAGSDVRNVIIDTIPLYGENNPGDEAQSQASTPAPNTLGGWERLDFTRDLTQPNATGLRVGFKIPSVPRGEAHYIDSLLFEHGTSVEDYFSGATVDTPTNLHTWVGDRHASMSKEEVFLVGQVNPPAETKAANTLISNDADNNVYSFGFFYTFSNEIGESAVSQISVVRTKRPWSGWRWETADANGTPSGTETKNPAECADQLVAYMANDVFDSALAAGAVKWSLYMFTWSDQDPVPVTAVKIDERELTVDSEYGVDSWGRATPSQAEASADIVPVPSLRLRFNSSAPPRAGQGVVAADRMILVFDPTDQAVIKWTSNQQGSYFDFSPSKGGGYKTLTSGDLYIPANVKLWQNPQSADTLTILCLGTDGHSTGYYMAPAQVASQSEAVNIMGFEESTATPGTASPYGVEVFNNALYHPQDEQLVKSTASNYNINHTSITDMIRDSWCALDEKQHIVSSQLDARLYYLVNNPSGAEVPDGCWGNEVWVFDGAQKTGSWSRWLTPGVSLRKIEQGGKVVMSLAHPRGIFYFDESAGTDQFVDDAGLVQERNIPWTFETNTQGANRAHDAWANLQQLNVYFGNLQGTVRYGIHGWDLHGKEVNIDKVFRDENAPGVTTFDIEDQLLIRKMMKEWYFFASSEGDEPCYGQVNVVQYRYTPVSVNVGYEYGSVETFEYARSDDIAATTNSGVPVPFNDTRRP